MGKKIKKIDHRNRDDLAGEAPFGDACQVVCFFLFLLVWIADSFVLRFSTILSMFVPLYINLPVAGILFILSIYIGYTAHNIVFKEIREPPEVIKKGVFKLVRHPLYFASILIYFSCIVLTLSLITLLPWVGIVVFYNYIAAYEEKKLEQKFGEDYIQYKKQVPRWIPRFFS